MVAIVKPEAVKSSYKPRALVVDDSTTSRMIVSKRLEITGVDVDQACEGAAALNMLNGTDYDLVILDLEMPGVDGLELLGCIRGHPKLRHLPVVVLTSDETQSGVDRALASGATSFLTKPLNWSAFGPHITNLIQLVRSSRIALENMGYGLAMYDADGTVTLCNATYRDMLSVGQNGEPFNWSEVSSVPEENQRSSDTIPPEGPFQSKPQSNLNRIVEFNDGKTYDFSYQPIDNGGWIEVVKDITVARRDAQKMEKLAKSDRLTGIFNRGEFVAQIDAAISKLSKSEEAVLFVIDVDEFKSVNDTLGHPVGDAVLQAVAEKLKTCFREHDIVGRMGGDEFAVLLTADRGALDIHAIAERMRAEIAKPLMVDGLSVSTSASIGYCSSTPTCTTTDELLRNADLALYDSKRGGRNQARPFHPALDEAHRIRVKMEAALRSATANGELELYYQPIVRSSDRQLVACEALIRWNHPELGRVSPAEFIPLAEEIGAIDQIGAWVIETACAEASRWPESIDVSINISACQFENSDLAEIVQQSLKESGLQATRLQLEITETALLTCPDQAIEALTKLKELGVQIAMDDFGTGFSSLNYILQLPLSKIKIDKSFIDGMPSKDKSTAIIEAVVQLARRLDLTVTAEGVETRDQEQALFGAGCHELQGYLFSKPVDKATIYSETWTGVSCDAAA